MKCKICSSESTYLFSATIIRKYDIKYYQCHTCKFIQTEEPFWLEEVYQSSITSADIGLLRRNLIFSRVITSLVFFEFNKNDHFLDYAGGYGVFTRIMRDIGLDFHWIDPYTPNLFAKGFEWEKKKKYSMATVFETFEHFNKPIPEIEKILEISKNIAFSTRLYTEPIDNNWEYLGFDHGQHIAFYHVETVKYIAKKYALNYYRFYDIHFLTPKKISGFRQKMIKLFAHPVIFEYAKRSFKTRLMDDSRMLKEKTA